MMQKLSIAVRGTGSTPRRPSREVEECFATCSPLFVINRTRYGRGIPTPLWTITHAPSGFAVLQGVATMELARKIVGVISRWPLDWAVVDVSNSTRLMREARKKMPASLWQWFLEHGAIGLEQFDQFIVKQRSIQ